MNVSQTSSIQGKTNLAAFNNSWYNSGANPVKQVLWYFCNSLFFCSRMFPLSSLKVTLLRAFGAKVGNNVTIKPAVNIKYPWKLSIANNVWIGEEVWIDNLAYITISDNVCISQGALLLCGNHNYKKSSFDLIIGKIILEEGVWIGAKAVVCPGVTCKSHAVLSVGSVATKNLEGYSIYAGNPAQKVRDRIIEEN